MYNMELGGRHKSIPRELLVSGPGLQHTDVDYCLQLTYLHNINLPSIIVN